MQFVDYSEDDKPLLVMEYAVGGNLWELREQLDEHEAIIMLDQLLQALEYLHNHGLVHRDIKPQNILLRSRRPLHLLLCDFGLANFSSDLKTFCGSPKYVAPEIRKGSSYTPAVDIWSLGVVAYDSVYNLPKADPCNRKAWYGALLREVNDWESDDLIDFLSSSMLRYNAKDRLPASDCRKVVAKFRQNATRNFEADIGTPTESIPSSVWLKAQRSAQHNEGSTAWNLDDETVRPTFIERGRSADLSIDYSKENECHIERTETSQADANLRLRARSLASTSRLSRKRPVSRPTSSSRSRDTRLRDHVSRMAEAANQQQESHLSTRELMFDCEDLVYTIVRQQRVSMRLSDFKISASQILTLAGCKGAERIKWLSRLKEYGVTDTAKYNWVSYHDGVFLCQAVGLDHNLEPLLSYPSALTAPQREDNYLLKARKERQRENYKPPDEYKFLDCGSYTVAYQPNRRIINATHLLRVAKLLTSKLHELLAHKAEIAKEIYRGNWKTQGTYISFEDAQIVCTSLGIEHTVLQNFLEIMTMSIRMATERDDHDYMQYCTDHDLLHGLDRNDGRSSSSSKLEDKSFEREEESAPVNETKSKTVPKQNESCLNLLKSQSSWDEEPSSFGVTFPRESSYSNFV